MAKEKTTFKTKESEAIHNRETAMNWVKFNYSEQPGQPFACSPAYTPIDPATGKRAKKNIYFDFSAKDGETVQWPQWFIENMNKITVPEPYAEKGPHGQIRTGIRQRNRFACIPVASPLQQQIAEVS